MVVASGGKSGLTGHRSAVREAREPRQIRAIGLTFTSSVDRPDKATHVRLSRGILAVWRDRGEAGGNQGVACGRDLMRGYFRYRK